MLTQHSSFARPAGARPATITDHRPTSGERERSTEGRVLHIVDAEVPGVGRHVLDLVRHQTADGWSVDVAYVPSGVEGDFPDRLAGLEFGVKEVLRLEPGRRLRRSITVRALRRFVREHDHDIVHGHGLRGGTWSQLAAEGSPARTVHTPNPLADRWPDLGPTRRSAFRHLEGGLSPFTDHLIHLSTAEAKHSERLGLLPVSWSVIPAGVEPVEVPSRDAVRARLGLPAYQRADDPLTIGWIGSLDGDSDARLALDAHARLRRHTERSIELVIVGDGVGRSDLIALAHRLDDTVGSPGAVRFVNAGPRSTAEAAAAMAAFDIFLLPSDRGGFPYELLEALWAGVPCVTVPNPVADTLLADAGAVAADAGADSLATAIATMIDHDDRSALARTARRRAETHTTRHVADEVTAIYRRLRVASDTPAPTSLE